MKYGINTIFLLEIYKDCVNNCTIYYCKSYLAMKRKLLFLLSTLFINFIAYNQDVRTPREPKHTLFSLEKHENVNSSIVENSEYNAASSPKGNKPSHNVAKSSNNNCVNAAVLSTSGAPVCFNVSADTYQTGELSCPTCVDGPWTNPRSVWFVYEATSGNTSININTNETYWLNTLFTVDNVAVYGPYTSQANATANCMPPASQNIFCISDFAYNYDPLFSYSYPTTAGSFYLMQISSCEDIDDPYYYAACVWVDETPANNWPDGSAGIDECGTVFNGTNIGYSPSNGLPGFENLDNNAGTTCPGCTAGENVTYVVNNDSWFFFCASAAGTYNVNFNGITGCINNDGLQMTIFRGSPTNLTTIWNAASPSLPGSSQTSTNFSVAAGECIYMVVDGFAGDQCNYSYTLNAVSSPCDLTPLPVQLDEFIGYNANEENVLRWVTASELNSKEFVIKKSVDGQIWSDLIIVPAEGSSSESKTYKVMDRGYEKTVNYYKLIQVDQNGIENWSKIVTIDNRINAEKIMYSTNSMGQKIDPTNYSGIIIDVYEDGTTVKRFQ